MNLNENLTDTKMEKFKGLIIITLSYIIAFIAGYFIFNALAANLTINDGWKIAGAIFVADAVMTVIIWMTGLIFKNSSLYDAYWSLIPFVIILFIMIKYNLFGVSNIIFLAVLSFWSWRLTINWAYTFESLKVQDWRYEKYRAEHSKPVWHFLNFFGINMMPTIFVFCGLLPGIFVILQNSAFNFASIPGAVVIVIGTILELFADNSMHVFRKSLKSGEIIESNSLMKKGLWKYSRHPNYFGEISVWLGVYLYMLPLKLDMWYMFFGFVFMVILFVFVSIPLAEKRQLSKRPSYIEYQQTVRMLIPLPIRRKSNIKEDEKN